MDVLSRAIKALKVKKLSVKFVTFFAINFYLIKKRTNSSKGHNNYHSGFCVEKLGKRVVVNNSGWPE